MDSLGHLWQVAIVLASQVPLELRDLLVELVKVEFCLLVHLQVLILYRKRASLIVKFQPDMQK